MLLFLLLHILDTSTVYFAPAGYNFFVKLYKNPLFGLAEIGLAAALVYHACNGMKLIVLDYRPELWEKHQQAQLIVWVLFVVIFVPIGGIMLFRLIQHNFAL